MDNIEREKINKMAFNKLESCEEILANTSLFLQPQTF